MNINFFPPQWVSLKKLPLAIVEHHPSTLLVLAGSLNTLLADLMGYKIGKNELNL